MGKTTNITLGPHFDDFIAERIKDGRYSSASEVIRAGLRLLENSEIKLESLHLRLTEAKKTGSTKYSYKEFLNQVDSDIDTD